MLWSLESASEEGSKVGTTYVLVEKKEKLSLNYYQYHSLSAPIACVLY